MADHPWRILLVEDDEDDFLLTRALLQEARGRRFELQWISSYHAALETLADDSLDVALVDYRLGVENGLDLIREAVARNCKVPIILLTGQGSYDVDLEAMKVGASDYLSKAEATAAVLERTIRYAIERRQAQEALQRAKDELETRVAERTRELAKANQDLRAEIAERRRAEAAVRESEERFRQLAETTSTAIFIVQEMVIQYANTAARLITGYSPAELTGRKFWEIAHPDYRRTLQQHGLTGQWAGGLSAEVPARYELKLLTKDGRERWADITAGGFEFHGAPALVVTAFDITERDLAEQALQKTKNELEIKVAECNHELKAVQEQLIESNDLLAATRRRLERERAGRRRAARMQAQPRLIRLRPAGDRASAPGGRSSQARKRKLKPGKEPRRR